MYRKSQPETIRSLFDSIACSYDRTNTLLSFGLHKYWNRALVNRTLVATRPKAFLDLCSGTGEIAFTYLKGLVDPCEAYLLDFSEGMLQIAKEKAKKQILSCKISYLEADAQAIPLLNEEVDAVTMAYGIRNVKDPKICMLEVYRVLRPGGTFGILELTQPTHPYLRYGHEFYLKTAVPVLGRLLTANKPAYQYLCDSIQNFSQPETLKKFLKEAGFNDITIIPLCGGIATIVFAKKPV
jgi:demethylmenaquinone methyltransferase/2-methoxy-6-polyprenyl-1,4-benzoquinol methylase